MKLESISFISISMSVKAEKKCTWNILKSNCKFQKMTDKLGDKANKLSTKIHSQGEAITQKLKKSDDASSDKIQPVIKSKK